MIPRIIHQYWSNLTGPDDPPPDVNQVIKTTRNLSRGFEHHLWNHQSILTLLEDSPRWQQTFSQMAIPSMKSDLARILVIHRFGGFYLDASCVPRFEHSVERFTNNDGASLVVAESSENSETIMNRIFAAEPENPFLEKVLKDGFEAVAQSISAKQRSVDVWNLTGVLLSNEVRGKSKLVDQVSRWTFEDTFALFTRINCLYKLNPVGRWTDLQKGKLIPIYHEQSKRRDDPNFG